MPERKKRKRSIFNLIDWDEEDLLGTEFPGGGSGYSISVTYGADGEPLVKVKTRGEVDEDQLRKEIEERYPGAKIEGLEERPLIRVVDEEKEEEQPKPSQKEKSEAEKEKKPSIKVID